MINVNPGRPPELNIDTTVENILTWQRSPAQSALYAPTRRPQPATITRPSAVEAVTVVDCFQPRDVLDTTVTVDVLVDTSEPSRAVCRDDSALDPLASSFVPGSLIDCNQDVLAHGQSGPRVQAVGQVLQGVTVANRAAAKWARGEPVRANVRKTVAGKGMSSQPMLPQLPFMDDPDLASFVSPARPVLRTNSLKIVDVKIPEKIFTDRLLPSPAIKLAQHPVFSPNYFVELGNSVAAAGFDLAGFSYPAGTPNFKGARIPLKHTGLNIERWRYHLVGYENIDIVQFLEHGFPLGVKPSPELDSCTRNHGSSYEYYHFMDKFIAKETMKVGLTGPFEDAPWTDIVCSPLMTAVKKPAGRRCVFDATFGTNSLNNATPSSFYMEEPCVYTYPKINDFRAMILKCGPRSFMFKRDLSRYFLQLPLCPSEYHRVAFVWRSLIFIFVGLMFGLRHSGLQGQKVTDAVSWIHRRQGLESPQEEMFNLCNYSDNFGGVQSDPLQAQRSFVGLGNLLADLGLDEASSKAVPPTTEMVFLGVLFNTEKMTMSVPVDKLAELKAEIDSWTRKTTISKRNLQSLLGRLFWVAKVVRYSRIFMGRLLKQLRKMSGLKDTVKVILEDESRKDLLWWSRFLRTYNGVSMILVEEALPLTLEQMLDTPETVCAGDATPTGAGAWYNAEYWSRKIPDFLLGSPIHVLEFWALIVSARLWGSSWSGRVITLFCDNDPVVDVVIFQKPSDSAMLSLLREFTYIVCEKKFFPVLRKIRTDENIQADFISRRFDPEAAIKMFEKSGLKDMRLITAPDYLFKLSAPW